MKQIFSTSYLLILSGVLILSWGVSHLFFSQSPLSPQPAQAQQQKSGTQIQDSDALIDQALQDSLDGRYDKSFPVLYTLANEGNIRARLYLGVAYYHGHGVRRNINKAREIFFNLQEREYEQGIVSTYLNLIGAMQASS